MCISMAESFKTLTEISEEKEEAYPIVVQVLPKDYEIPEQNDLPYYEEIVIEKPKCLQFAFVRIATFLDERQKMKEKGDNFVKERNEYIGQDFLIPLCYPGTLKLLNKSAYHGKYSTISQVKQDLPRYIRIDQEMVYTPPNERHATSSLDTGARLEVKSLHKVDNVRYVKFKSVKTSREYIFRSDSEIMCSAVDDPKEHTLLSLAAESVLLPKIAQFQSVWADDIVVEDDDEASQILTLTGGPIKILKLFVKVNVFIAWLKPKESGWNPVALIPKNGWDDQIVEVKQFDDELAKEDYIKTHFGEDMDSNFVTNALYMMKPKETGVIWLRAPKTFEKGEGQIDYDCVVKKLVELEKAIQKPGDLSDNESGDTSSDEDKGVDNGDYEEPMPKAPPIPQHMPQDEVKLPFPQKKNSRVLEKLKKAVFGSDKASEHLHKRAKTIREKSRTKNSTPDTTVPPVNDETEPESDDHLEQDGTHKCQCQVEDVNSEDQNLTFIAERNRNRPLPGLPQKSYVGMSQKTYVNITDVGAVNDVYDEAETKEEVFKRLRGNTHSKLEQAGSLQDLNKMGRPNQSREEFYSYTVEELEECFKVCSLSKLAVHCSSNMIDGEFFRDLDLNELKSEPWFLGNLEVLKVKKIIENGWRPKTGKEQHTSL